MEQIDIKQLRQRLELQRQKIWEILSRMEHERRSLEVDSVQDSADRCVTSLSKESLFERSSQQRTLVRVIESARALLRSPRPGGEPDKHFTSLNEGLSGCRLPEVVKLDVAKRRRRETTKAVYGYGLKSRADQIAGPPNTVGPQTRKDAIVQGSDIVGHSALTAYWFASALSPARNAVARSM